MGASVVPPVFEEFDRINHAVYQRPRVVRHFGAATGWLDPGERTAVMSAAESVREGAILDIGVGGGRTAPLLQPLGASYVGIDYAPAMVAAARQRFPDCEFQEMDARQLSFADNSFALAVFSYNGIDWVDLAARKAILREIFRVLRPGGYFVFSALTRHGGGDMHRWPDWSVFRGAGYSPWRWARGGAKLVTGAWNHLRRLRLSLDNGAVAIGNVSAHNFALLAMFTSLSEQIRQLYEAGFVLCAIFDPEGEETEADTKDATAAWYYYVAQKAS